VPAFAFGLALLSAACGTDSPSSPSQSSTQGGACRFYSSASTITYSDGSSNPTSCSFDRSQAILNCVDRYGTPVRRYKSVADFVDEGQLLGRILTTGESSGGGFPFETVD
jgi:hypothetical protein